jgi:hypothetical protein
MKRIFYASMVFLLSQAALAQEPETNSTTQEPVKTEQTEEKENDNFFKRAFRDMKESAQRQHEIDKANFEATKLESKASFKEHTRKSSPAARKESEKERMERELKAAEERKAAAQKKLDSINNL